MENKSKLLEEILKKYRPDLSKEYRTLLSMRLTKIEKSGKEIYDVLAKMNEPEKILYLGLLIEVEHIRQYYSYLASYPKEVSPTHKGRSSRS